MTRRSRFRRDAELIVSSILGLAGGLSAKCLRHALRRAYLALAGAARLTYDGALPKRPRAIWYAAVRSVAGCGVLAITYPRQQPLPIEVGPARRRPRRRKPHGR